MEQFELLKYAADVLEQLRIQYFVTGSMASMFYSEHRFTNDIDIVLRLPPALVEAFCKEFPQPEFYISEDAAAEAVRNGGQFNVIHVPTALKIDFMTPRRNDFDDLRFGRRVKLPVDVDWGGFRLTRGRHHQDDAVLPGRPVGEAPARHHRNPAVAGRGH